VIYAFLLENPLSLNFTEFFSFFPTELKGNQKILEKLRHGTQGLRDFESLLVRKIFEKQP